MKRMIFILMSVLMAAGCNLISVFLPETPMLELSENEFILPSGNGEILVDITYVGEYEIVIDTDGDPWIHEVATKATEGTLTFSIDANEGYDDRHAMIEVSVSPELKEFIRVTQKQKDALMLSKERYEIAKDGGEFSVDVMTNVEVNVSVDEEASSWLTCVQSKGLSSETFHFRALPNDGRSTRSGKVAFTGGGLREVITVYQIGVPVLVLSNDIVNLTDKDESFSIDVTANVPYEVVMPEVDWITLVPSVKSMVTGTVEFDVKPNETYDAREAVIVIRGTDSELTESVKVVQSQKDAIVAGKSVIEVGPESGTFVLTVGSNVDYEVTVDSDWLRQVPTKAFVEEELEFIFDANHDPVAREAVITLTDGMLTQNVKVVQEARLEEYVLRVTHENAVFTLPSFKGTVTSGMIYWGDGLSEEYSEDLVHDYGRESEVTVEIILQGGDDDHLVRFENITGITEIDLSGM